MVQQNILVPIWVLLQQQMTELVMVTTESLKHVLRSASSSSHELMPSNRQCQALKEISKNSELKIEKLQKNQIAATKSKQFILQNN